MILVDIILKRYVIRVLLFIFCFIIFIVEMFVVGFVIKNINIVSGDNFVVKNFIVSGVEVVV